MDEDTSMCDYSQYIDIAINLILKLLILFNINYINTIYSLNKIGKWSDEGDGDRCNNVSDNSDNVVAVMIMIINVTLLVVVVITMIMMIIILVWRWWWQCW